MIPGRGSILVILVWTSMSLAQTHSPASQPATQNSAASVSDVAAQVQAGQYTEALKNINKLLPSAQGNGSGQDRHELLMLRTESQMHLKSRGGAVLTLEEVARGCEAAGDVNGQSEAIALATLIQRSGNFVYIPRTQSSKTPLNILDPETRKSAYTALLADEMAALRVQENTARSSKTLAPLLDISQAFARTQAIERTANGGTTQTTALAKELSKWATAQVEQALDEHDAQITKIATDIGRKNSSGSSSSRSRGSSSVKRGLDQDQSDALTDIATECEKIPQLAQQLNKAFGQPDILGTTDRAEAIGERAKTILDGGYAPPVPQKKTSSRSGKAS